MRISINTFEALADPKEAKKTWEWEAAYTGEVVRNLSGGVQVGTVELGLLDLKSKLNFEATGGTFFLHLQGTHGKDPTSLVGDAQVTSNMEAAVDTGKVYEAYYFQPFDNDRASVLFGLYDLNSEFYATEGSGVFTNSSFGINKEMSQIGPNGPSIFPTTSLAARVRSTSGTGMYVQAAAFEATSGDPDQPYGTQVKYSSDDGLLLVTEVGYEPEVPEGQTALGKIAVGLWQQTKRADHLSAVTANGDPIQESNEGAYVLSQYAIKGHARLFARYGVASSTVNQFGSSLSAGIAVRGALWGREFDEAGFGVASANNGAEYLELMRASGPELAKDETTYELTYKIGFSENLSLQPDLQYVVHPSTDPDLKNALVASLRLRIGFAGGK